MSAAATVQVAVPESKNIQPVPTVAAKAAEGMMPGEHPLLPVLFAMLIALVSSVLVAGSIMFWLEIRNSGVLAP